MIRTIEAVALLLLLTNVIANTTETIIFSVLLIIFYINFYSKPAIRDTQWSVDLTQHQQQQDRPIASILRDDGILDDDPNQHSKKQEERSRMTLQEEQAPADVMARYIESARQDFATVQRVDEHLS